MPSYIYRNLPDETSLFGVWGHEEREEDVAASPMNTIFYPCFAASVVYLTFGDVGNGVVVSGALNVFPAVILPEEAGVHVQPRVCHSNNLMVPSNGHTTTNERVRPPTSCK